MDRSDRFRSAVAHAAVASPALPESAPAASYPTATALMTSLNALHTDASELVSHVEVFASDATFGAAGGTVVSRSAQAITVGADRLKEWFAAMETRVSGAKTVLANMKRVRGSAASSQHLKNLDRILESIESRLASGARMFRVALEKRAEALTKRQERQQALFGTARQYSRHPPPEQQQQQHQPASSSFQNSSPPRRANELASSHIGRRDWAPAQLQQPPEMRRRAAPAPLFDARRIGSTYGEPHPSSTATTTTPYDELGSRFPQQQQQYRERESQKVDKTTEVLRIEKTISELASSFMHFAGMVHEQGQLLADVEANVDDTVDNVEDAQRSLLKLLSFVTGDRALIIKLFIAVTVMGLIIIYFWT